MTDEEIAKILTAVLAWATVLVGAWMVASWGGVVLALGVMTWAGNKWLTH